MTGTSINAQISRSPSCPLVSSPLSSVHADVAPRTQSRTHTQSGPGSGQTLSASGSVET